ncbi:MAG: alpha/beta fold hydrolase [Thermoplasmata archaeon]|nr:alpha/beta fold hydrolase [Thermoplasmata archaeon]
MKKLERFRIDEIDGVMHLASEERFIICCHGLYSSKESEKYLEIAEMASRRGISCVRFDFRGCGESGGEFSASVDERVKDLHKIMEFLDSKFEARYALLGSSLGGMVSIRYAAGKEVASIITLATPYEIEIEGRKESIAKDVKKCSRILVMHGQRDELVSIEHAINIYENAQEPKKIMLFPTDHSFSERESRSIAMAEALDWAEKYFDYAMPTI